MRTSRLILSTTWSCVSVELVGHNRSRTPQLDVAAPSHPNAAPPSASDPEACARQLRIRGRGFGGLTTVAQVCARANLRLRLAMRVAESTRPDATAGSRSGVTSSVTTRQAGAVASKASGARLKGSGQRRHCRRRQHRRKGFLGGRAAGRTARAPCPSLRATSERWRPARRPCEARLMGAGQRGVIARRPPATRPRYWPSAAAM
jgi:hypothetical protein